MPSATGWGAGVQTKYRGLSGSWLDFLLPSFWRFSLPGVQMGHPKLEAHPSQKGLSCRHQGKLCSWSTTQSSQRYVAFKSLSNNNLHLHSTFYVKNYSFNPHWQPAEVNTTTTFIFNSSVIFCPITNYPQTYWLQTTRMYCRLNSADWLNVSPGQGLPGCSPRVHLCVCQELAHGLAAVSSAGPPLPVSQWARCWPDDTNNWAVFFIT